ncbi:MAG: TIGR01212 family radical SAM protein [Bacteroidaceae bacterium]|nr:TIGR01212 family radical SAM protein [Bacteroidaceae bacterium]
MKLQKIMIDAGFSCPNRDGSRGIGGCTFCRNDSFNPSYCRGSITEQIAAGKRFFADKYPDMKYLAYFQAYSNTHAPIDTLKERYAEALQDPDVVGLVIATRPDCLPAETVQFLSALSAQTPVTIEIGVETLYDRTLERINRCHTAAESIDAITRCADAGLPVTAHFIIGLPGETEDDILAETEIINTLPITSIKLHQLQILKGTPIEQEWLMHKEDFLEFTAQSYISLVQRFLNRLDKRIQVERIVSSAPSSILVSPRWGLKPATLQAMLQAGITSES